MAKIWLKLQENGEKKSLMAKVMAKEKYILARTLERASNHALPVSCWGNKVCDALYLFLSSLVFMLGFDS